MIISYNNQTILNDKDSQITWDLNYLFKILPTSGKLVYEYNPLRNFRVSGENYEDKDGNTYRKGSIIDLDTEYLNFDLSHPLDIISLQSYDGSVNLIFNDNNNIPRLINSRFTVKENNTYQIIDRVGNNDTNLYDSESFNKDTSLYKKIDSLPRVELLGVYNTGNLKVGNYTIYLKYSDVDDNETDFIAESGMISCFAGIDSDPSSIQGGYKDLNSLKSIHLLVKDLETDYDYIKAYYTRAYSDIDGNVYTEAYKVLQKYPIIGTSCAIAINGNEDQDIVSLSDINIKYLLADSVKTQDICQNRLFFGNITIPTIDYEYFKNISLYIYPKINLDKTVSLDYTEDSYNSYYNTQFIYNYTGYWNEEIYRFGIVYILTNGSLSPVFNIRGRFELTTDEITLEYTQDKYLSIQEGTYFIEGTNDNALGVSRIKVSHTTEQILGIEMIIPDKVKSELKNKVIGYFFVRQKRIPTIVSQALLMPVDIEAGIPLIYYNNTYLAESFIDKEKILTHNYLSRLIHPTPTAANSDIYPKNNLFHALCPDYDVCPQYYNQIFTSSKFKVKSVSSINLKRDLENERHYISLENLLNKDSALEEATISAIPDATPLTIIDNFKFRNTCGEAATAYKVRYLGYEPTTVNKEDATNIIRGIFGPTLGIVSKSVIKIDKNQIINIYIPEYAESKILTYFRQRYEDNSPYYAISDRYNISSDPDILYRGDCYICQFTHRLNRNFQDPDAPINDIIVDEKTWLDHISYNKQDSEEKRGDINRGDVNAVQLGSWITFTVRSSRNLCLRSLDYSYPQEEGLTGKPRGFYPYYSISAGGESKLPESSAFNAGFGRTVGERWNYTLPDAPYYKNIFLTRIAYSDITINDAYKNGYRVFEALNYRDYPTTYGGLMKLVEVSGNLLAIFEHGIALIPVNERTVAGTSEGGDVFINTSNVLPLNPSILSDTYGTQWPESVIKTDNYVYGVDTVAKKIWRVVLSGGKIELISDLKILKFLNDNITLSERELTPFIGIRNVKTHYNAFKQDIMFTFYDMLNTNEETVWNLCFNELQNKFITFYSWVPSYSANIDNIFFSFDRDTSKWISKLGLSNAKSHDAHGICLDDNVMDVPDGSVTKDLSKIKLSLKNIVSDNEKYEYTFELINSRNNTVCKNYGVELSIDKEELVITSLPSLENLGIPVLFIDIKCTIKSVSEPSSYLQLKSSNGVYKTNIGEYIGTVAITTDSIFNRKTLFEKVDEDKYEAYNGPTLFTHFWKHGQSGIIDIKDKITPCFWYGKQHPFEFEFVVAEKPDTHKVFDNLRIISNKAEPESFHYEIVGEVYDFSPDKKNMYYRQEATKALFNRLGSDITYNHNLNDLLPLTQNIKSTTFIPTYYRQDHLDKIYDSYGHINDIEKYWVASTGDISRDYIHLSGAEIVYDPQMSEFKIWNHAKGANIKKVGRRLGNMQYLEDCWEIQINSLIFALKNENNWVNNVPPISIVGPLPNDVITTKVGEDTLEGSEIENKYNILQIQVGGWTQRKETKMRDKFIRIRVRYSGKDLAVIMALKTFYTVSYA